MKPIKSLLALLMASAISQTAMAEDYGLQVCGVNVTSSNCKSLFDGTVSYDPEKHVLSLNNANLSHDFGTTTTIINTGQDLTIDVTGSCRIASWKSESAISSTQNLTFRGSGFLTIDNGFGEYAIKIEESDKTLRISNCKMRFYGKCHLNGGKLFVQNSDLTTYNFIQTGTCTLQGCGVKTKEVFFSPQDSCFVTTYWNGREYYPFDIEIAKVTENYNFQIAGHSVNDVTAQNFYFYDVTYGQDGFIQYDAKKRILTMKNATLDCHHAQPAINMHANSPKDITLTLRGDNSFENVSSTAGFVNFTIYNNLTINGDGTLSMEDASIQCFENSDLTIGDSVTLNAGFLYGRGDGNTSDLKIGYATINLLGTRLKNSTTIHGFASVTSKSLFISPNAAWYDKKSKSLKMFDGTPADGAVTLDKVQNYGIQLNGIIVHDKNCDDILRDIPHTGLLSYAPAEKVLLMDNLTYEANSERGGGTLYAPDTIQNFIIQLKGDSELKNFWGALLCPQHTHIVGPGSFTAEKFIFVTEENNTFGTPQSLTIKNCTLQISTLEAYNISEVALCISNAHLRADNQFYRNINADYPISAISGFSTFTMEKSRIVYPEFYVDGKVKYPYYAAEDDRYLHSPVNSSIYNGEIIIEPAPLTVEDITNLISRYLDSEGEVTVEDITNLIDEYLNSDTPDIPTDPRAVDLGLSVKWATMNIGATTPEEYGDYFAWGETMLKATYSMENYKWAGGSSSSLTKYNNNSEYGPVDDKMTLEPQDDAAYTLWGGTWRMPSSAEMNELKEMCTWVWVAHNYVTNEGVSGYNVTGPNGNSIFLPAAGWRNENEGEQSAGEWGNYWTSSLQAANPIRSHSLWFSSDNISMGDYSRWYGRTIRPVCP